MSDTSLTRSFRFGVYSSFSALLLLLVFNSCGKDANQEKGPLLEGHWEIERALRNGREAESLSDLYFKIGPETRFETNISGAAESGDYEVAGDKIESKSLPLSLTYAIVGLTDSTLRLKTTVSNYRFELLLRRVADEKEEKSAS